MISWSRSHAGVIEGKAKTRMLRGPVSEFVSELEPDRHGTDGNLKYHDARARPQPVTVETRTRFVTRDCHGHGVGRDND